MSDDQIQIITFYEFKPLDPDELAGISESLRSAMREHQIKGTVILAAEGFNSSVSGKSANIGAFISDAERILNTVITFKSSFHETSPFRKSEVKIKLEIVTLKKDVDIALGRGTHVPPEKWNELISDPEVLVLDTRNDYEYKSGTFVSAVNPRTDKFSDLPEYVETKLEARQHTKIAMFCTGGIRCEKFAPYMKALGFENIFQLEGGILKYLETVPKDDQLWQGECFVFDQRITVDKSLQKGTGPDLSVKKAGQK